MAVGVGVCVAVGVAVGVKVGVEVSVGVIAGVEVRVGVEVLVAVESSSPPPGPLQEVRRRERRRVARRRYLDFMGRPFGIKPARDGERTGINRPCSDTKPCGLAGQRPLYFSTVGSPPCDSEAWIRLIGRDSFAGARRGG